MKIDAMFVTDGDTVRIKRVSEVRVAVNDRVIAKDAEDIVEDGDRICLGDTTMLWKSVPARAAVAVIEQSKTGIFGGWAWRTFLQGTALVAGKPMPNVAKEFAAPCPDVPHLHVFSDAAKETVKRLADGVEARDGKMIWQIGSAPDCQVRLSESGVSRLHARLANEGHTWSITDEVSVNGVYVNGTKTLNAFLASGDVINIAGSRLVVHLKQESPRIPSERIKWFAASAAFVVTCVLLLLIRLWWKR